jgi:hypothetical protein
MSGLENGEYLLRIRMVRENGQYYEKKITVRLEKSEPEYWQPDNREFFEFNDPEPENYPGSLPETEFEEIYLLPTDNQN